MAVGGVLMDWRNHGIAQIRECERILVSAERRGRDYHAQRSLDGVTPPWHLPVSDHLDEVHRLLLASLEQTKNECLAEAIVLLESAIQRCYKESLNGPHS